MELGTCINTSRRVLAVEVLLFNSLYHYYFQVLHYFFSPCSIERMEKANSRFRIGLMFVMMGFSVAGSAYAVMLGKRDRAEHVNSVTQQNMERHAKAKAKSLHEK